MDEDYIPLSRETEMSRRRNINDEVKARIKFTNFCKANKGAIHKDGTYCKINKRIKSIDIKLTNGIAEFVSMEE